MLSVGMMVLGAGVVSGQEYPNKPIRIVTTAPGGGGDFVSRIIAEGISGPLGQPVIVDNRATGLVASEFVSKAPPDGYTLTVAGGAFWILPLLLRKAPYDVVRDFSPISLLVREVNVVVVVPSLPVNSITELIALAKKKPGALNYASTGVGGTDNLATELFKSMAGVNIVHVPYKGTAPGIAGLLGGEVQMAITDSGNVAAHVKSGRLKALAVTTAEPSTLVPGLPTVAASGLPGYEMVGMTSIFAPAKTPVAIIKRLNQEIVRVLNLPSVRERFFNSGVEVVGSSPEQLAATVDSEIAKDGKIIRDAGIKVD
jgi:tripartite-type tricarboxylate transporter receptor subunit TctC